ncbi:unnamed protein product [Peniophora sp. CBMAI 1063]|nr:unnamed protein product [Peniophora sp. CBMAI 1063]
MVVVDRPAGPRPPRANTTAYLSAHACSPPTLITLEPLTNIFQCSQRPTSSATLSPEYASDRFHMHRNRVCD